jgi:hypothetical protein
LPALVETWWRIKSWRSNKKITKLTFFANSSPEVEASTWIRNVPSGDLTRRSYSRDVAMRRRVDAGGWVVMRQNEQIGMKPPKRDQGENEKTRNASGSWGSNDKKRMNIITISFTSLSKPYCIESTHHDVVTTTNTST